jgi:Flp pilus assembly pilin Flp
MKLHLKTLGKFGWLIATRFWIVMGVTVCLFLLAVAGLWVAGRNDLMVVIARTLTTDTAIWVTVALYPVTLVSVMLYGFWYWEKFPRFLREESGQDLLEYALMAGFVVVAAGAIMPGVVTSIRVIRAKIEAVMAGRNAADAAAAVIGSSGGTDWIRIVCAVLAVLVIVLIILRRRRLAE